VRGDIWQPATADGGLVGWLELSADTLAAAPTVTVAAVTAQPPAPDVGWPLAIALTGDDRWWVRVTQLHTLPRDDLSHTIRRLPAQLLRRIDTALARTLGITAP
jgi:mRNA-degrading endonuclease toxin of MazEF toxin-antitoxin module